ncbi:serine hydrolase [candidate division KSB1 bacterium]|nr:serine hydrolase [candidate division KSB1 bacterium]
MTDADRQRLRERALAGTLLLIVACYVARLVQVQLIEGSKWAAIARKQSLLAVYQKPARGEIRDVNGWPMATTLPLTYAVGFRPIAGVDRVAISGRIAPILNLSDSELRKRMRRDSFVYLARRVDVQLKRRLEALDLACLVFDEEPRRTYPGGVQAACVVGFADVDGRGQEGIEVAYDSVLSGAGYRELCRVDALRKAVAPVADEYPAEYFGADVTLSIDLQLQTIVEEQMLADFSKRKMERGCAILVDPKTGDILSMSTYPTYDPNHPESSTLPARRCWPVTDVYEPGSTFKMIPIVAALEAGRVSRTTPVDCEGGSYRVRGATIHDAHAHGTLTVDDVLAFSSNIGAAKIGQRFTPTELYDRIRAFGFGNPTFVEMLGEQSGVVPRPAKWSGPTQANLCYGHGVSCTALQLLMAYAAIANDGLLMKPRLVRSIEFPNGTRQEIPVEAVRQVVSPSVAHELTDMLENVVEYGTAKQSAVEGIRIAAKTGTAQKVDRVNHTYFDKRFVSSLVGFFPAEDPQYALLVLVDDPRGEYFGSTVAGPVYKAIVEEVYASRMLRGKTPPEELVNPKTTDSGPTGAAHDARLAAAPVRSVDGTTVASLSAAPESGTDTNWISVPSVEGWPMRLAVQEFSRRNLGCELIGSRIVKTQSPQAGTRVQAGTVCQVVGITN